MEADLAPIDHQGQLQISVIGDNPERSLIETSHGGLIPEFVEILVERVHADRTFPLFQLHAFRADPLAIDAGSVRGRPRGTTSFAVTHLASVTVGLLKLSPRLAGIPRRRRVESTVDILSISRRRRRVGDRRDAGNTRPATPRTITKKSRR